VLAALTAWGMFGIEVSGTILCVVVGVCGVVGGAINLAGRGPILAGMIIGPIIGLGGFGAALWWMQGRQSVRKIEISLAFFAGAAPGFFGAPPNTVSPEMVDWCVRLMLDQCSLKVMLDLHRVFTKTDFRADLPKVNVPVLLVHGERDTSALIDLTARRTVTLLPHGELKVYEDAAHGLPITHMEQLNAELLAFARR